MAYAIATTVKVEVRRRYERQLVQHYLSALAREIDHRPDAKQRTLLPVPSLDDAMVLYAQSMAWGLVIGWLMCPPVNYGEEIWLRNVNRLVAACKDLQTFSLLRSKKSA